MIEPIDITVHETGPLGALQSKINELIKEHNKLEERFEDHGHAVGDSGDFRITGRPTYE